MRSLFSLNPAEAGFRFHYAEILNWGTFDGKVYRIVPQGETSLITGANGSGKTTFIDALLTLLVPEKRNRFYNQSSGAGQRHERTEESYVLGEFGQTSDQSGRTIQRLREREGRFYSVLLAAFFNQGEQKWLTLAQLRWFSGSELKRSFIVAPVQLGLTEDFIRLDTDGTWKKRLKTKYEDSKLLFFDQPGEYSRELRKQLGMRSEKAQSLFSQTIGLKVLGNLNDFIRGQMLEESSAEEEFQNLKSSYEKLLNGYNTLKKLREQLSYLEKIEIQFQKRTEEGFELSLIQKLRSELPVYEALERQKLLLSLKQRQELDLKQKKLEKAALEEKKEILAEKLAELDSAIRQDATGQQIKNLDKEIRDEEREKSIRQKNLSNYNRLSKNLDLVLNPDQSQFYQNLEKMAQLKTMLESDAEKLQTQIQELYYQLRIQQEEFDRLVNEIQELNLRRNNITGDTARIRSELVAALKLEEKDLPFAGELLRVKASELQWELAIEKVLHHFAQHILVPEMLTAEVNAWVHSRSLKGRIRYFIIKQQLRNFPGDFQSDTLPGKLEIHPETANASWIKEQLRERFDYLCSDDLALFRKAQYAVTSSGLIRSREKHQKDDREFTFQRNNYVLGWENSDKIRFLKKQLQEMEAELKRLKSEKGVLEGQHINILNKLKNLDNLQENYNHFESLDWQANVTQIEKLKVQRSALESENDQIKAMKDQLEQLKFEDKGLEKDRDQCIRLQDRLEQDLQSSEIQLKVVSDVLQGVPGAEQEQIALELKQALMLPIFTDLENLNLVINHHQKQLEEAEKQTQTRLYKAEQALLKAMREFKNPEPELQTNFPEWRSDTYKLGEEPEDALEYLVLADKIRTQGLVEQESRFQKYFNGNVSEHMTAFEFYLENQKERISENILALNRALKNIHFKSNPPTYIQLEDDLLRTGRVAEFRQELKSWKPNAALTHQPEVMEESFLRIKHLIDSLEQRPEWRKEVIDVRNWMTFSAQEYYAEDHSRARSYETTGKLSGGEKAQLTYTILAAALAYQFNISLEGDDVNSFRFICVDESFSNQDDEKAAYLMQLCQQLHLQLLVVTPNDKVHVVEPFISRIHLVLRRDNRESVLIDMPIETYLKERPEGDQP